MAAGLVGSCQRLQYLEGCYPDNAVDNMPNIACQMRGSEHNSIMLTQMFHEIIDYPHDLYGQIAREGQGMIFAPYGSRVMALTDRAYLYREHRTV